jgi:hypothetical protein
MLGRIADIASSHPRRLAGALALMLVLGLVFGASASKTLSAHDEIPNPASQSTHAREAIEAATVHHRTVSAGCRGRTRATSSRVVHGNPGTLVELLHDPPRPYLASLGNRQEPEAVGHRSLPRGMSASSRCPPAWFREREAAVLELPAKIARRPERLARRSTTSRVVLPSAGYAPVMAPTSAGADQRRTAAIHEGNLSRHVLDLWVPWGEWGNA